MTDAEGREYPAEYQSLFDSPTLSDAAKQAAWYLAEDHLCANDALYWAQHWTATENPKCREQGLPYRAPLPRKSYFVPLFDYLKKSPRLFIPKTREMLTSYCVMAYGTQMAQWHQAEVIVQTESEDKAKRLIEYSSQFYRNQPEWMKQLHPLARGRDEATALSQEWEAGGKVFGIPKGEHKIRMYHPTVYIMDEAAFLPEAEQCFNAAAPVAAQIIAISSAGPGWFATQCER